VSDQPPTAGAGPAMGAVDFYRQVVLPALPQRLDQAFPEFGFRRDPHGWVATNQQTTHQLLGVRADRVVATAPPHPAYSSTAGDHSSGPPTSTAATPRAAKPSSTPSANSPTAPTSTPAHSSTANRSTGPPSSSAMPSSSAKNKSSATTANSRATT
jgi:hypothetical protein